MTFFIKRGTRFNVTKDSNLEIVRELPPNTYSVEWDEFNKVYFLEEIEKFNLPEKVYGNSDTRALRILNTFLDRPGSTGVQLSGEKGSGKTLLAKQVSVYGAINYNIPTFVVNQPFTGDIFNQFIQSITQPVIVLFDEFEKVYDDEHQNGVLTLFDGVFASKKLFLVTCNNKSKLSSFLVNRPGRFFYSFNYTGLDEEFIREYAMDNLKDPSSIDDIIRTSKLFEAYNFDMLKALIEELNRYGETVVEAMQYLNLEPDLSFFKYRIVSVFHNGTVLPKDRYDEFVSYGDRINILDGFSIYIRTPTPVSKEVDEVEDAIESPSRSKHINFSAADIVSHDNSMTKIVAHNQTTRVEIEKVRETKYQFIDFM